MAGVAGSLGAELLGQGDWYQAPLWVSNLSMMFTCQHKSSPCGACLS